MNLKRQADSIIRIGGSRTLLLATVWVPLAWLFIGLTQGLLTQNWYQFALNQPYTIFSLTLTAATLYVANDIEEGQHQLEAESIRRERMADARAKRMEAQNLAMQHQLRWITQELSELTHRIERL